MRAFTRHLIIPALAGLWLVSAVCAGEEKPPEEIPLPKVFEASNEGEEAIKKFTLAPGLKVNLYAAEPDVANIVAFSFDLDGKCYVCEDYRRRHGVMDLREFGGKEEWQNYDLSAKTVEDRAALLKRYRGKDIGKLAGISEKVRVVQDRNGDGKSDYAVEFATGFDTIVDGTAEGVLAYKGNVWFANIPNLWLLRDDNRDGKADYRKALHYGYGTRIAFQGHDLHGLRIGPDGKLYFTVGDRGANIILEGGKRIVLTECGGCFRCNLDGSELELFATGLRNPQCLTFDQHGNLFTGDNNSDSGDKARWVYIGEGGDSGWRFGYQLMEAPSRGPWNTEKLWHTEHEGQAAYILPPIAHLGAGPSGVTYFPGVGLPEQYKEHFFMCDFTGGKGSGVWSFALKPKGATFEMEKPEHIILDVLATDVGFGPDCSLYVSDWVEGWRPTGKGRIYRIFDPEIAASSLARDTKSLLGGDWSKRSKGDLAQLLTHPDMRVRQEAQFELVARGKTGLQVLTSTAGKQEHLLARLHAIWGLGMLAKEFPEAMKPLPGLLKDSEPEVRAQAAKVLGEQRVAQAFDGLVKLLNDPAPRPKYFAALALGKLGRRDAASALMGLLRANDNRDKFLRHAGAMGLLWLNDSEVIFKAARDDSAAVRMAAALCLRRMERSEAALLLNDADPAVALEAARAIHDIPITGGVPELTVLLDQPEKLSPPLLWRAINANFRWGTPECAQRLVKLATNADAAVEARVFAMDALALWEKPPSRDRVTGSWIPNEYPRDGKVALDALQPVLAEMMKNAPIPLRLSTARAAEALRIADAGPIYFELIKDRAVPIAVRTEALRSLAARNDARLGEALKICAEDTSTAMRKETTAILVKTNPAEAAKFLNLYLVDGFISDQKFALNQLAGLPGEMADKVILEWMDKLLAGQVANELVFDLLEVAGKRENGAIKERVKTFEAARKADDPLAKYRELLYGGNAGLGRQVFFGKQEAQCVRCHKVVGKGGEVGPNLSDIGKKQPREYLLEAIVLPNKMIAPGFESVTIKTAEGKVFVGTVRGETADEVTLMTANEGALKFKKTDIASRKVGLSGMPDDIHEKMSRAEIRNVVEFLVRLQQEPRKPEEKTAPAK